MDEPSGTDSPAATGNIAIPDWMLKRRARLTQATEPVAEEVVSSEDQAESLPAVAPDSEVTSEKGYDASRREPPAWFRSKKAATVTATAIATPASEAEAAEVETAEVEAAEVEIAEPEAAEGETAEVVETEVLLPEIEAEKRRELEWHEELRERWLSRAALRSFAVSIFTHILIAAPLSLLVFHQEITDYGFNTILASQDEGFGGEELNEIPVMQMEAAGGTTGESLDTLLTAQSVSNPLGPSTLQVPDAIGGFGAGEGKGVADQVGDALGGYKMPEGGKAVSKGSFTAWTVPEDPAPGEDYKIVIQVKYKKRNQKIPKDDISGSVVGTDRFRLMISQYTSEIIPDANQVVVFVPGAAARVRDTIRVNSALLKENQRLEIVF